MHTDLYVSFGCTVTAKLTSLGKGILRGNTEINLDSLEDNAQASELQCGYIIPCFNLLNGAAIENEGEEKLCALGF